MVVLTIIIFPILGTLNLLWLQIPLGMIIAFLSSMIWLNPNMLDVPEDIDSASQYRTAVILICVACILDLCGEPFWVISQVYMYIKFRALVEFFYTLTRAVIMAVAVYVNPKSAILAWGWSTLIVSFGIPVINAVFYHGVINKQNVVLKKKDVTRMVDDGSLMPFTSVTDILPKWSENPIHLEKGSLMVGFFKQGILKQVLTEGEAYMFTFFNLMSLAEQGVYNVASQFGSLAGRLIFSKVEEAGYFYFSQTVTRGEIIKTASKQKDMEEKASLHLYKLLRMMILVGIVVAVYAQSYSHMLLHLYGGEKLSSGIGPSLLRSQSIFLVFMAVNGVSECYAFASMTTKEVEYYKYLMFIMTCVFLFMVYQLAILLGPIGFVAANCCNFSMRIAYNFNHIIKRHQGHDQKPWRGVIPPLPVIIVLGVCGSLCYLSELYLYQEFSSYDGAFYHFMIGVASFLMTVMSIILSDEFIKESAVHWLNKIKIN